MRRTRVLVTPRSLSAGRTVLVVLFLAGSAPALLRAFTPPAHLLLPTQRSSSAVASSSLLPVSAVAPQQRSDIMTDDATRDTTNNNNNNNNWSGVSFPSVVLQRAVTTAFVAATLWCSPAVLSGVVVDGHADGTEQQLPPVVTGLLSSGGSAFAKELASGSGSRVNKDPESLLRYGLPINNKDARNLQGALEDIKLDIGSKRKTAALNGVQKSRALLSGKKGDKLVAGCRSDTSKQCQEIIKDMVAGLDPLSAALKDSMDSFQGSEQERDALDRAYTAQQSVVDKLTVLEENMIPAGYRTPVPDEYKDLPQLTGRAEVEMVLQKPDKSTYDVAGSAFKEAKMTMIVDGYAAPVTAGNFIDLVQKGFYNNMAIQRSDGFVVQTGDPDGEAEGYVGTGSASVGNGKHGERLIPLEIFVRGDSGPIYETSIEDDGRGGQATVLPFSSYGAMGWAREEYDPNSGSSQFFWLLFDSDLTPAGKNVLDGQYPCFGYVVKGEDFLRDVDEGDIIISAKVTKGLDRLVRPA